MLSEADISEAIELARFDLGESAEPVLYRGESDDDWPFEILLEEVAQMLPERLAICTIAGGAPGMSCFKNSDPALIVFNSRYQTQLTEFRRLLSPAWKDADRGAVSTRTFLKAIAQLALREGNGNAATAAFLRATTIPPPMPDPAQDLAEIFRPVTNAVVDTPYVVSRFYGIAHEVGHVFASVPGRDQVMRERYPDRDLVDALNWCAEQRKLPETYGSELPSLMFGSGSVGLCDPAHLREEAFSDVFAVLTLLPTAVRAVEQQASREFHPGYFAQECEFMSVAIHHVELCRRLASVLGHGAQETRRDRFGFDIQACLATIRKFAVRPYLQENLAALHFDNPEPTDEELARVGEWLQVIDKELVRIVPPIRAAMLEALNFVRSPLDLRQCRGELTALRRSVEKWPEGASHPKDSFPDRLIRSMGGSDYGVKREAQDFVNLAREKGAGGELVDELENLVT
jgi:hypothetical protein